MKYVLPALISAVIFCGCGSSINSNHLKDSITRDSIAKQKAIDKQMQAGNRPESEEEVPTGDEVLKETLASYNQIIKIDSLITDGNNNINIHLKSYCLHDSSLVIPARYNWWDKTKKDFRTNNFATQALIIENGDTIFNKVILRADFKPVVKDESQHKYGVLSNNPSLRFDKSDKAVIIGFSFSIPLTDVGKAVYMVIDNTGKYKVYDDVYMMHYKLI